ncbi:MAG: tetratricopeptide repeat protein [Planctomycetota bacterium]
MVLPNFSGDGFAENSNYYASGDGFAENSNYYAFFKQALQEPKEPQTAQPQGEANKFQDTLLAAEQGDLVAQCRLGYMYLYGNGVDQDYHESLIWFQRAADHGLSEAQLKLGALHAIGKGVYEDSVEAYKWFQLAGMSGEDVTESKTVLEKKMSPDQIAEAQKRAEAVAAEMEKNEQKKTPVKLSKGKFRVCVQVDCEDESLKYKLLNLRKKELRKIADVRVVAMDEQPDYIISLAAVINKAGDEEVGYSYSYAFLRPHYAAASSEDRTDYLGGGIQAVPQGSIKNYCQSEVASFNETVLAPLRNKE